MPEHQVSLVDETFKTFVHAWGDSAILSLLAILVVAFAFWKIFEMNRGNDKPRFDALKHMEHRPTIEHQPQRSLPPAEAYKDWAKEDDNKQKDNVPWR